MANTPNAPLSTPAVQRGGQQRRQVALPGSSRRKPAGGVRGGLLLLGVLLVVASGGAFWYILRELDVRQEYLVTVRTIERREVVRQSDFGVIEANLGDGQGLPPRLVSVVAGRWATGRIPAGTIITPGMFQAPPLSNDEEADKVLIEVSLPGGEAPGGALATGDKVALFGAEVVDLEIGESEVGLIGVLELDLVAGDEITYVVTPSEAKAIQELVDRYMASTDRRIWKLGSDLSTEDLIDLYGSSNPAPVAGVVWAERPATIDVGGDS